MKAWTQRVAALGLLALSGAAQAALVVRGGGMIYDTTLNITWLADMNYAKTSGYAASGVAPETEYDTNTVWTDGRMGWDAANAWANNLVYGGYDDWRLPTMVDTGSTGCTYSSSGGTDCGYNVQTAHGNTVYSEMAHLYYETLGNKAYCNPTTSTGDYCEPQAGYGLLNVGPFVNMQLQNYWYGTEHARDLSRAWVLVGLDGEQRTAFKYAAIHAVAVRPGDVTAAVPEPQTWALTLLALGAAAAVRRRRAA